MNNHIQSVMGLHMSTELRNVSVWSPYRQIVDDEIRMRKGVQMSPGQDRLKKLVREAQAWNNRENMKRFKKRLERERIQSGLLTDEQQMAIALRSFERKQ